MKQQYGTMIIVLLLVGVYGQPVRKPWWTKEIEVNMEIRLPQIRQKVRLYTRQGFFLTIDKNGNIGGDSDPSNVNTILEMQSFNVQEKRIRRPNSYFLYTDKNGILQTTLEANENSIFAEAWNDNKDYLTYENIKTRYMLGLNPQAQPVQAVKRSQVSEKNEKQFLFLIVKL